MCPRSHGLAKPKFILGSLTPEFVPYSRLPLYMYDPVYFMFKE